uniref:Uncharacterized protein n=1 Tax=Mycena chlorophos TaxID=658473 RepID=A0ABQ0LBH8_MYCCL|nr:predicted protein [Mycena chlorophos]
MTLSQRTLIIIIAASAGAGLLLSIFVLYRCLRRPQPVVPLPPKQELAHYRSTHTLPAWHDPAKLSTPHSAFGGSRSSLFPPDSRGGSPSPLRHASFNTSESPSDELVFDAPLAVPLEMPHLPFHNGSSSNTSLATSTAETDSPPLPSATDSSFSRSRRSRRPLSVGSSSGVSRRSTIRGAPHAPHNNIQIVLPTPLAFNDIHDPRPHQQRYSTVDQWAPAAVRSEPGERLRERPSSASGKQPRRSSSQSSLARRGPSSPVPPVPELPNSRSERGRVEASQTPDSAPARLQKRARSQGT